MSAVAAPSLITCIPFHVGFCKVEFSTVDEFLKAIWFAGETKHCTTADKFSMSAWSPAFHLGFCNDRWEINEYTLYYGRVFKGRWVFKGNLVCISTSISSLLLIILCLAVTLLTSTKVQLGSKELNFLTKENNTDVDYHIWIYILYESVDTH